MEYVYICPRCNKDIIYKSESGFQKAKEKQQLCRDCRDVIKGEAGEYYRACPKCEKIIYYKRKSDLQKAIKNNCACLSCSDNSGKFKKGELQIRSNNVAENSLDRLLDLSLQSFY